MNKLNHFGLSTTRIFAPKIFQNSKQTYRINKTIKRNYCNTATAQAEGTATKFESQELGPIAKFFLVYGVASGLYYTYTLTEIKAEGDKGLNSDDWIPVTATVTKSERIPNKSAWFIKILTADLEYEYEVHGEKFTGTNHKFQYKNLVRDEQESLKIVEKYRVGREYTVYYNPKLPSQSVVLKGRQDHATTLMTSLVSVSLSAACVLIPLVLSGRILK